MRPRSETGTRVRALLGRLLLPGANLSVPIERLGVEPGARTLSPRGLDTTSVVYAFGIGRELSFERTLVDRFGVTVHVFDPTPRSVSWLRTQSLPGAIICHEFGVAGFDGTARFLPPSNPNFVSFSMVRPGRQAPGAIDGAVLRLASVMRRLGHDRIDLLKLDVEGSEYAVLDDLATAGLDVRQILVEFHHRMPGFWVSDTRGALRRLHDCGYRIFHATPGREDYGLLRIQRC